MKLSNFLLSTQWDLNQTREAISALEPLFKLREEFAKQKEREFRDAQEGFREVSVAISILKQREGELLSDIIEISDDEGWVH